MSNLAIIEDTSIEQKKTFRTAALSKGAVDGRVSAQWATRPDDQKFLNLNDLLASVKARTDISRTIEVSPDEIRVNASSNELSLLLPDNKGELNFTNWSFGQACSMTRCPSEYLRKLPSKLAGINLQHGLMNYNGDKMQAYVSQNGHTELRSMNSLNYGRIYDVDVVRQIMQIAGNGTGDTNWKVPGMLDWGSSNGVTIEYNPYVDITKETTTLYASDRDMYVFLVDDTHPIEIGKLRNGEPDLVFRGFIVWNSETGAKTFGMSTMLLRGVCCNRNLWGVEGSREIRMRHSRLAPTRFMREAAPMLEQYANMPAMPIVAKVAMAKATIVASNDEERTEFLTDKVGLSKSMSDRVLQAVLDEEETKAESIWDMVQGMTAVARGYQHQDTRLALEEKAGKLMDKIR